MPVAASITVLIFLAGVVFTCGRLSARVDQLESWSKEIRDDIRVLRGDVADIAAAPANHRPVRT